MSVLQLKEKLSVANRHGRRLTKSATLGGDPEESFEQAFASLAFSYIKDKAPRLLESMAGFQLVDRNEDNTKAIGLFGFRLGKQWVYAPVFFLNGDLKGHELLYLKGQDLFVPLKENWVNYLLAKKPHLLGEQTSESVRSMGVLQPDIRGLSIPPFYSKYSSAEKVAVPQGWPDWAVDFLPALGSLTTHSPNGLEKFAGLDDRLSLPKLCSESLCIARMTKQALDLYPEINRLCDQHYGRGWLKSALEKLKDEATKEVPEVEADSILGGGMDQEDREERWEAKEEVINKDASFVLDGAGSQGNTGPCSSTCTALCHQYFREKRANHPTNHRSMESPTCQRILELGGLKHALVKMGVAKDPVEIKVIDDLTITQNDPDLSDDEREKAYKDGYLVKDYRKGDEVSKAYSTHFKCEMINPDQSGLYDVLTKPGKFEEILVVNNPTTAKGKCDFATVVRTKSPKNWINAHRATLWVKPQKRSVSEQREFFDGLDDAGKESLTTDDTYMVLSITAAGGIEGSTPFFVRDNLGDGRYKVEWLSECDSGRPSYLGGPSTSREIPADPPNATFPGAAFGSDEAYHGRGDLLFLTDREGVRFKSMQGTLMAPSAKCKVIKVSEPEMKDYANGDPFPIEPWQSSEPAIEPGDWGDLQLQISQKTAELKVYCDGEGASINGGPLSTKKSALFELIQGYGFREKQAKQMIKTAEMDRLKGKPSLFRAKYAQGYPQLGPGPSAPAIPEPQVGHDGTYGGYPTQYQQIDHEGVPEMSSGLTDQSVYDPRPEAMPDPMSMQGAQQAGQTGQKEVFDTAMISSMLKAVRQDSLVDRYTGDLMKALDRLGRILFLFYWHNDEFMERYGKSDMPELEDTLRNTFESLGDLLLFLKEKDVDPLVGGPGQSSSPDIQDAS